MSFNLLATRILKSHWESVERGAKRAGRVPDHSKWRIVRDVYVAETTEPARREALKSTIGRDFEQYFLRII